MRSSVLDTDLQPCGLQPRTGFRRDGFCSGGPQDLGSHTVCAVMTEAFLQYTLERGNDLITPRPEWDFPGLRPGDRWCLCAARWEEARLAGVAPPVILAACDKLCLEIIRREDLFAHALAEPSA
ncbi:DUF2237 domain-containing protein [Candidatus Igneacidithiobacillus taiwanensis]|uniref:DUF2237 family protein n=1 Tax=Candidatus Igneacidithiobacillus taiwanensis TaxID=1945924 RepID=UPI0028A04368|nr:DUF2237 domain-containing protein [Candidatus Igneacidithiobacillus taiwanensis]MCE5360017.1 DUF2237 domain-containing protein [Acidithiobacillus sp.]